MPTSRMASRVAGFGTSIFTEISALAREHNAVNLGQGFPDFDGPDELKQAAQRAIAGAHNQYAISNGETPLREAIAAHAMRFYGQSVDPVNEITVTAGATEAIFCSILALIEPGDEVIVFEPCYDSYVPSIRMAGGVPVAVTLHAPEFRFDPDELRAAVTPRTKAIYVNTPHNPSGTAFTADELAFIASLCREHDLLAVTDEVYEHIIYSGSSHVRLATLPGMWERTLTISSGGKSFSFTGWKVGWAIGPEALQTALRRVHQFTVFASTTPVQHAIAEGLHLPDAYFTGLATDYQRRRDYLMTVLANAGLQPKSPNGSYFILANIDNFPQQDGTEFSRYLIREVGVAAIPLDSFYLNPQHGRKWVRFCFCKRWETLEAAAERLEGILKSEF